MLKLKFKRFVNVYGPTETTVWSSSFDVDNLEDVGKLEESVADANTFLVFLSAGYFKSFNCRRQRPFPFLWYEWYLIVIYVVVEI